MPAGCCKTAVVKRVLFLSIRIVCTLHGAMRQGLLRCELLKMREIYFRQISGKEISFRDRNLEDGAAVHLVLMHGFCAAMGEVQLQATTARQALGASSAARYPGSRCPSSAYAGCSYAGHDCRLPVCLSDEICRRLS